MILKSILLTLLLATSVASGQGVQVMDLSSDSEPATEETQAPPEDSHEIHSEEDTEALVRELEEQKKKQAAMALAIEKTKDDFGQVGAGAIQDLQKEGKLSLESLGKMDDKAIGLLQAKLREAHMSSLPEKHVRQALLEKTKGRPLGKLFERFPALADFCVDFVRHDEALPSLLGIFAKREQLKTYFYVWLVLLILSFLMKRYVFPKKWKGFKRFAASLMMSLLFLTISLTVFYQLFHEELSPTVAIISKRL